MKTEYGAGLEKRIKVSKNLSSSINQGLDCTFPLNLILFNAARPSLVSRLSKLI